MLTGMEVVLPTGEIAKVGSRVSRLLIRLTMNAPLCETIASGESRWRSESFGKYWSLVYQDDKILALDESGMLYLIRANPDQPVGRIVAITSQPAPAVGPAGEVAGRVVPVRGHVRQRVGHCAQAAQAIVRVTGDRAVGRGGGDEGTSAAAVDG